MLQPRMEKPPSHRLHEIVLAIPAGEISATARRCGLSVRYLMKMRGEIVNVGIDSFAKLCAGLGRSADDLLGLATPAPSKAYEADVRAAEREAEKARRQVLKAHELLGKMLGPTSSTPPKSKP